MKNEEIVEALKDFKILMKLNEGQFPPYTPERFLKFLEIRKLEQISDTLSVISATMKKMVI